MLRGTAMIGVLLACSAYVAVHGLSVSHGQQGSHSRAIAPSPSAGGRKLFGGYWIAPKACRPTNPGRLKSDSPAVCMFNYECSLRRGQVVGTCMDGFLFGACCQLPSGASLGASLGTLDKASLADVGAHEIDHVPDIPILLNPDGTPVDAPLELSTKSGFATKDAIENAEKTQLAHANLEEGFSALLGSEQLLDELKLPSLLAPDSNNSVHEQTRPVTTLLSPDQILQVADPVDQLPALFSHGLEANDTGAETILLDRNGTRLNETNNPDEVFRPWTTALPAGTSTKTTDKTRTRLSTEKLSTRTTDTTRSPPSKKTSSPLPAATKKKPTAPAGTKPGATRYEYATTPMTPLTTRNADDLVRISTIQYSGQSGNKKHDEVDNEEIAINHIISLLNDTSGSDPTPKVTTAKATSRPPTTYKWSSSEASARPTLVRLTTRPTSTSIYSSPNYYHYNSPPVTEPSRFTSFYTSPGASSSRPASTNSYNSRPTTNPPAPTVIVLGPLDTTEPAQSTPPVGNKVSNNNNINYKPTKPSPTHTSLTHNVSTVVSNNNKQVVQVSFISVNLKDGTTSKPSADGVKVVTKRPSTVYTTLTSWSEKPSFYLRPVTTSTGGASTKPDCEDSATAASDDVNNFPPVRHPELNSTVAQEKPEVISADEISTPDFVEDAELNNKVDVFVNKIVDSLQGNFQNLKDVLYNPKNVTTVTRRPHTTTRRPTTRRPTTTPSLVTRKPTTLPTKKATTKRTKPTRKATTVAPTTEQFSAVETEPTTQARPTEVTTKIPEITPNAKFRDICGIRPLMKTGRIVGGRGATFGEWPWQVLVREATWLGLFTKNKCGGVLITDKYVITAAHCQPGFLASLVAVFGEFDISGELESRRSVSRNVRRVIAHSGYDPATFENDLALLELESPIQFDQHIVPICMPDDNADYTNRMATVTGWGRLKYNGGVPSVLQEVKVPIMENSVCQEMFLTENHQKIILESFMCAGYANGQKDSCEGDSGGPLTLQRPDGRWILVGTVSHGIKCAAPYLPGVYMRTTYFKPWLHSITGV
ncbi:serine protease filzig [Phymastichus coffea]|uniref:serine protease filzig n=1 Tax=Phymastichus coffea TaxID=108790 RepID=UPI00273ACC5E|nr:serine protease filzig [Phymastichus coffea]